MVGASSIHAQTERALERRADRLERRAERRMERASYFTQQAWQELNPWIRSNGVDPQWAFNRAARAMNNAAVAENRAAANEIASDRAAAVDGRFDVDVSSQAGTRSDWYGFRNNAPATAWFYDYYTIVPSYTYPTVVETQTLTSPIEESRPKASTTGVVGAVESVTVEGEVVALKQSRVGGKEHLIAKLDLRSGAPSVDGVDLGPVDRANQLGLTVGANVKATGWTEQIGEKQLLVANSATNGDQVLRIDRSFEESIEATVIDLKEVQFDYGPKYIAIVESDGSRMLVDLGPVSTFDSRITPKSTITIVGTPVRSNDQILMVAKSIAIDGTVIELR
ncbi:hypothetical protein Mal15_54060 [Stieleria maiorica]|uniref:DUF5666 domain-containing protein n=1 Tax=Stieleria maiorica TaxID=2795974 RepID=A0A5B9MLP7_9BACT|nr:hypothetical protein [Stieleria maiorica]QEG01330.1 hypothetical protein Mal15_54060 [Stieleria maiorica]